jgi:hypothetical protein
VALALRSSRSPIRFQRAADQRLWDGTAPKFREVTNPKLIAPLQMFRGMADLRGYPEQHQAMRSIAATHMQGPAASALLGA